MSSKFAKQFNIPPEFPDVLKDFTREVLRNQPVNIYEFAAKYFDCLSQGLPSEVQQVPQPTVEEEVPLDEVESIIQELFRKYDSDGNGHLDATEFKSLMTDLQSRLSFPPNEVYRFLAEADMNSDGLIEYEEFIPLALQIIQSMYAKKQLEQHRSDVEHHAEDLLVHGMAREELTELIASVFERIDVDFSGQLSKAEFVSALTSMELGLTRREINTIMFQIDSDKDGNISYREFVPFAFDLLQKLTSLRLLETELENDDLALYLADLFKAKDTEMSGLLHANDIRDLLHEAMLGLSRMQIYTVISEAEVNTDMMIAYPNFIPTAVGLIRSMLSFEKGMCRPAHGEGLSQEKEYYEVMGEAFAEKETTDVAQFMSVLESTGMFNEKEALSVRNMINEYGESIPVELAKGQVWGLVRGMRHCAREE